MDLGRTCAPVVLRPERTERGSECCDGQSLVSPPSCHIVLKRVLNSVLPSCHPVFSPTIHPSIHLCPPPPAPQSLCPLWDFWLTKAIDPYLSPRRVALCTLVTLTDVNIYEPPQQLKEGWVKCYARFTPVRKHRAALCCAKKARRLLSALLLHSCAVHPGFRIK
ncbi:unnamed protein product [Pleuronectes platessa]|uniref:Uncharacterized protein n=1 Tax=Pleuronectes platessa TaxID=8262 RepID=A0A9N7YSB6_PLEPL|nr:unnamed protein product [Pleuronectes platessa]